MQSILTILATSATLIIAGSTLASAAPVAALNLVPATGGDALVQQTRGYRWGHVHHRRHYYYGYGSYRGYSSLGSRTFNRR